MDNPPPLCLASTSRYRAELLSRLALPFRTAAPHCDEKPLPDEKASDLVARLAEAKATSIAASNRDAVIIGSDQIAECDGELLGKPGNFERATVQLQQLSGHRVTFHTGLCVLDARSGDSQLAVEPFSVIFRSLEHRQIERYLWKEKPFDCAGSFKSEGLGIALFERFEGADPTALIGLPLMRLVAMLGVVGIDVP
ncbi:MAG: Maf family nucleotide pyrophosphatase [Pseudomonadota bacterium]